MSISRGIGGLPTVVKNLLIINVIMYLALLGLMQAFNVNLNNLLGLHYPLADDFRPYQLVTYMFMHSLRDPMHILMNMFAVWMFGRILEQVWGPKRFLTYYIVTGVGAVIVHLIVLHFEIQPALEGIELYSKDLTLNKFLEFTKSPYFVIVSEQMQINFQSFATTFDATVAVNPNKALDLASDYMIQYKIDYLNAHTIVGASGAVFGILLAFGMLFPNVPLQLMFIPIPIKAKYFVIGYGAIELYSGISNNPGDNVAHFAHLGGMIFGYFLVRYWKNNQFNQNM